MLRLLRLLVENKAGVLICKATLESSLAIRFTVIALSLGGSAGNNIIIKKKMVNSNNNFTPILRTFHELKKKKGFKTSDALVVSDSRNRGLGSRIRSPLPGAYNSHPVRMSSHLATLEH